MHQEELFFRRLIQDYLSPSRPYPFKFFKGYLPQIYLVHSWILCPICCQNQWEFLVKKIKYWHKGEVKYKTLFDKEKFPNIKVGNNTTCDNDIFERIFEEFLKNFWNIFLYIFLSFEIMSLQNNCKSHFVPMFSFDTPENIRKPKVSRGLKRNIGKKWVKYFVKKKILTDIVWNLYQLTFRSSCPEVFFKKGVL